MSRPNRKVLAVLAAALVIGVGPAYASSGDVIRDCSEDGALNRHYSQRELSGALDQLPSDLDEYTDCRSVIRRAQLAGARGKGSEQQGILRRVDRKTPPSPDEQQTIDRAARSPGAVHIGGRPVQPGGTGAAFHTAGLGTDLPGLVLAALVGLGATMLWAGAFAARRRWPAGYAAVGAPLSRIGNRVRRGIARFRR
jgi:hypothetical protein